MDDIYAELGIPKPSSDALMGESLIPQQGGPQHEARALLPGSSPEMMLGAAGVDRRPLIDRLKEGPGLGEAFSALGIRAPMPAAPRVPVAPRIRSDAPPAFTDMQGPTGILTGQPAAPAANFNRPQAETWSQLLSSMSPEAVLTSPRIQAGARQLASQMGTSEHEAMALIANTMWQHMGANRYITPELVAKQMQLRRSQMQLIDPKGSM